MGVIKTRGDCDDSDKNPRRLDIFDFEHISELAYV